MIPNPDEKTPRPTDGFQSSNQYSPDSESESIETTYGDFDPDFAVPETPAGPEVVPDAHRPTNQHPHNPQDNPEPSGVMPSPDASPEQSELNRAMNDETSADSISEKQGSITTEDEGSLAGPE